MRLFPTFLAVVGLLTNVSRSQTLDLGNLDQYDLAKDSPQDLLNTGLWLAHSDDGEDFEVFFGEGVTDKLLETLQACEEVDNRCYQSVYRTLDAGHIQTPRALQNRQWQVLIVDLGASFTTAAQIITGLSALAVAMWANRADDGFTNPGFALPQSQAESIGDISPGATVTLSAEGTAVATITQVPEATAGPQGGQAPSISAVAEAEDGFAVGDLAIDVEEGLAGGIEELMSSASECEAGRELSSGDRRARRMHLKRQSLDWAAALCASEAVLRNVYPQGPMDGLRLFAPSEVDFDFTPTASGAEAAVSEVEDFARAYAPLMAVEEDKAAAISRLVLLLAITSLFEGDELGPKNRVKAEWIGGEDSPPSGDDSECPPKDKLTCGMEGEVCPLKVVGEGEAQESQCKKGKYENCPCSPGGLISVHQVEVAFAEELSEVSQWIFVELQKQTGVGGDGDDRGEADEGT